MTTRTASPVGEILRSRHVLRLLTSCLVGRLPTGMAALAIILWVRSHGGDYRLAGLLAALYAVSVAVCGPIMGRLIDRTRQAPFLVGGAVIAGAAFVTLSMVDPVVAPVTACFVAVVAGAATPQLEPCLRVLWEHVTTGERQVRAAYALDAATQELIFVCGPVVVLAAVGLAGTSAGLLAAAVVGLAGTLWFASAAPARAWRGSPAARHWAGPLRAPNLVRLFAALVCMGCAVGAFTVGVTARADGLGTPGAAAWLLALNAVGALVSGLAYTNMDVARRDDRRLALAMAVMALAYLPLLFTDGLVPLAVLAFACGAPLPVALTSSFALVARIAPPGTLTESHAWMITSFGVGYAAGTGLAGTVIDAIDTPTAFLLAVVAAAVSVLWTVPRLLPKPAD